MADVIVSGFDFCDPIHHLNVGLIFLRTSESLEQRHNIEHVKIMNVLIFNIDFLITARVNLKFKLMDLKELHI